MIRNEWFYAFSCTRGMLLPSLHLSFDYQLVFNPEKRICVEEALEHPYVGDLHAEVNRLHMT